LIIDGKKTAETASAATVDSADFERLAKIIDKLSSERQRSETIGPSRSRMPTNSSSVMA
jgi:hypothetical protein